MTRHVKQSVYQRNGLQSPLSQLAPAAVTTGTFGTILTFGLTRQPAKPRYLIEYACFWPRWVPFDQRPLAQWGEDGTACAARQGRIT